MRSFHCTCGNQTFFDNSQCVACGNELGFCPSCRELVALLPTATGGFQCGNSECNADLQKCFNYVEHNICNRCVSASTALEQNLCDCCRFSETIPDLTVEGNLKKWARLESAKRRLFYDLDQLGLPYGKASDGIDPPLRFDFKADVIRPNDFWRSFGKSENVYTGHDTGQITINIREADDVEREKLRVDLGEAQRTLIGHFRHEIGHFYWDLLVKGRCEPEFIAVFGDHNQPTYADALDAYYKNGPAPEWRESYISAYATMHPWEDFAETWASYLDMISTLDTTSHNGLDNPMNPIESDLVAMVTEYQRLGIIFNEVSRSFGLLDVVPEIFVSPVVDKLEFIHQLVLQGREMNGALQPALNTLATVGT
jgi:hypothetical protein